MKTNPISKMLTVAAGFAVSVAISAQAGLFYDFENGMQDWHNTMTSTAQAGYYDLWFGPAQQTGHDNWGQGPNASWSVAGLTQNVNGDTQTIPSSVGSYFLGAIPFQNQIGSTDWVLWPAAGSGAHQTIMVQSPAFKFVSSGELTYFGMGSSQEGANLTTVASIPLIGGTWGADSGNPDSTKGNTQVGLLRDDGVFVLTKNFTGGWSTHTWTASELEGFVNDGHTYTLNMVDYWSGRNSLCQIDNVNIPGAEAVPEPSSLALLGLGGLALMFRKRK